MYQRAAACYLPVHQFDRGSVWSFGEDAYPILRSYLFLRERLRPYIHRQMDTAAQSGRPVMRPLFFDFPEDTRTVDVEDAYLFGPDILVAPILESEATERPVYLPAGTLWRDAWTNATQEGGQTITAAAPRERIPVFLRHDSELTAELFRLEE